MHELGIITDKDWQAAKARPVKKMLKVRPAQNTCGRSTHPYFCEYVIAYARAACPALGKTIAERTRRSTRAA